MLHEYEELQTGLNTNRITKTRMHSSGMRTIRCSRHLGGGLLPRWVSAHGMSARGVSTQGVYRLMHNAILLNDSLFWMVCALSYTGLIRKILAIKIKVTATEMLAVCHRHIADNMSSMGHTPGRDHCPAKDCTCHSCQRSVTGNRSAGRLTRPRMPTRNPSHNLNIDMEEGKR